ncbi:MAG: hypothetical protein L6R43_09520, partial [Planctomycetes bacterium]|nr:hypothetical protein [Planctomycetota bacterium]
MTRARRARPVMPPPGAGAARALDRLHRLHRRDPAEAARKAAGQPGLQSALHARLAAERAREGDAAGALAEASAAAALPGGDPDAVAAALLAAAEAEVASGPGEAAEARLLDAFSAASSSLGRGVALARLALLYRDRSVPLGFRFYAPRALRILDRGAATGLHPAADLDAARLACAVLEYHHRRDEPERSGRAFAVLDRVRDADPFTTVQGLKFHGLALGKLQEWEASWKVFAEAARLAEEHDLRGCDGIFVYAAAVMVQSGDFAGARRLLSRVHIRRLDPGEKKLFRQFRHLVETAQEHRPLPGPKAEKFLRAQRRREKLAEKRLEEEAAAAAAAPAPAPAAAPAPGRKPRAAKR